MKYLIIAIVSMLSLSALTLSNHESPVPEKPQVQLNAAQVVCFEVADEMRNNLIKEGREPSMYFDAECGTEEESKAFEDGTFTKV